LTIRLINTTWRRQPEQRSVLPIRQAVYWMRGVAVLVLACQAWTEVGISSARSVKAIRSCLPRTTSQNGRCGSRRSTGPPDNHTSQCHRPTSLRGRPTRSCPKYREVRSVVHSLLSPSLNCSNAAFQNARKSEFPSSFFRLPSSERSSELGTRKFIEIQIKWRNLTVSCKLISM